MTTNYPQTGSILTSGDSFGTNTTETAISTNILIAVRTPSGYQPVGAVQQLQVSESRTIKMVDEVGTDGHIDSVPMKSTDVKGSCQRIRFQKLRVAEAFDRGFLHVSSQVYPFDIVVFDKQKFATNAQVTTIIKNVWISDISYTYSADNWIITDTMQWEAEQIYSQVNGGPAATGGQNNLLKPFGGAFNPTWIESQTDMGAGGRRGSLDAAGLIDIGTSQYPGSVGIY
jgi:hypothetical protein